MINFKTVKPGDEIHYLGDSLAYGGTYKVINAESTYIDPNTMPEDEKGTLMIVEFMNDDTPIFINIERLNQREWEKVDSKQRENLL